MLEWLTGLLALMTGWLAWETRDMARATKTMAELSAEPYLSFIRLDLAPSVRPASGTQPEQRGYTFPLTLMNPGQVRVAYEVDNVLVTLDGRNYPPDAFDNRGGYIHPKEEVIFNYPFFECATPLAAGLTGFLDFDLRFWTVETKHQRLTFRLRFWVSELSDTHRKVSWVFMTGPTYA